MRDFYGVVHQLKPDQAWIVCVAGFTSDAEKYARDEGIGLAVLRPTEDGEDNRVKVIHFRMQIRAMGTPAITSWLALTTTSVSDSRPPLLIAKVRRT